MSNAITQLNENKTLPLTMVDNGEGYLKMAIVKETGQILPLKDVIFDEEKKNVRINPYNPSEILITTTNFLDDNRLYKIDDKKFEDEREKLWKKKIESGETMEGKDIFFYEAVFPEDGGIKFKCANKVSGYIYPVLWDGAPPEDFVLAAASFKKLIPILAKNIKNLFHLWTIYKMFPDLVKFVRDGLYKYFLKREAYSSQIRELYDFGTEIQNEIKYKEITGWLRDIGCFYLQFDYSYKHRASDIMGQVRKEEFVIENYTIWDKLKQYKNRFLLIISLIHPKLKNKVWNEKRFKRPVAEIYRCFNVLISRDYEEMNVKWRKLRDLICLFLEFSSYFCGIIQKVALKTDFSKMALTEENLYWCSYQKASYDFMGKDKNQLERERIAKYGK